MPRQIKRKVVGSEVFNDWKTGKPKRTVSYKKPSSPRKKGGKFLNLNKTTFVKDLTKIQIRRK